MNTQIHKAYPLTTTWKKLEPNDEARIGLIAQNQSVNAVDILLSQGEQSDLFAALEITPRGDLYEDILPAKGQIWACTRTGEATLTLVLKY